MRDLTYFCAINLDSSRDRWLEINAGANQHGIQLERIPAVDGRTTPKDQWENFEPVLFRRYHGVEPLSGEYGCFASHLKALRSFINSNENTAVIMEDDAVITAGLVPFVRFLDEMFGDALMLVRLTSHRQFAFEALGNGNASHAVGQCWFGPTGSSAAYWVSRKAAQKLISTIVPGYLPFDIALERSWATGVPSFLTKPNVMPVPRPLNSTIIPDKTESQRRRTVWYKRIVSYIFQAFAIWHRLWMCAKTRRLPSGF